MNTNELINYYNKFNENKRLLSRHGMAEFNTSIKYILKYLEGKCCILDVGAGTGRYSGYFSDLGYDVTAVELVKHNLRVIEKNYPGVKSYLGNAIDLSRFNDNTFDAVILFGPMYHLISYEDKVKALKEAKRVVKDNGYIFVSYLMNDYAIIRHGFMDNNIVDSMDNGLVDSNYQVISKDKDLYSYVRLDDIDSLKDRVNLKREKIISQDGLTDYIRKDINKLSINEFNIYLDYHLSICEKYEYLGYSSHVMDILRK